MSEVRDAIENLLYRYAEAIDAGDFDAVGALFANGTIALDDGTPIATGAEAVTALYTATTRRYDDGTPRTQHVTTNARIDVAEDGTSAVCRSRFTVFQQTEQLPLQPIIAGHYTDTFAPIDGQWHFTERRMRPTLYGDLSQHLLIEDMQTP
ncbi:MAG: nuclear transport factor 2 family protein [Acidobacteria bacterium]|nr:nuclear transport factor 2 family protein [Acidobacteriota bacterium]